MLMASYRYYKRICEKNIERAWQNTCTSQQQKDIKN